MNLIHPETNKIGERMLCPLPQPLPQGGEGQGGGGKSPFDQGD